MSNTYTIPSKTQIGHVHLKVADLERSLNFYHNLLGFEITLRYGNQAAFISAGAYHHHIALNTWNSKDDAPASKYGVGLYHTAILYPTRKDFAVIYQRLQQFNYPLTGASNHGVSEAIYLDDPDGNGVELYWDKPKELWPKKEDGSLNMFTNTLNLPDLLNDIN